jgi:hypothetical protein
MDESAFQYPQPVKTVFEVHNKVFSQLCETREDAEELMVCLGAGASSGLSISERVVLSGIKHGNKVGFSAS